LVDEPRSIREPFELATGLVQQQDKRSEEIDKVIHRAKPGKAGPGMAQSLASDMVPKSLDVFLERIERPPGFSPDDAREILASCRKLVSVLFSGPSAGGKRNRNQFPFH